MVDQEIKRRKLRRRYPELVLRSWIRLASQSDASRAAVSSFELQITEAHPDWMAARVGCELSPEGNEATCVRFYHPGWPEQNENWRISCFCRAMYLRILRRNLEYGETVEYERRLDA